MPNLEKWDKSKPGNSQPSSLVGTCLTLPNLGFLWVFFKYSKISKNGNLLFFPVCYIKSLYCWRFKQNIWMLNNFFFFFFFCALSFGILLLIIFFPESIFSLTTFSVITNYTLGFILLLYNWPLLTILFWIIIFCLEGTFWNKIINQVKIFSNLQH